HVPPRPHAPASRIEEMREAGSCCGGFPPPPSARLPRALASLGAWHVRPRRPTRTRFAARPASGESSETPLLPAVAGVAATPAAIHRRQSRAIKADRADPSASATLQPKCPPALAPPEPAAFKVETLRQTKEVSSEEEPPVGRGVFLKH